MAFLLIVCCIMMMIIIIVATDIPNNLNINQWTPARRIWNDYYTNWQFLAKYQNADNVFIWNPDRRMLTSMINEPWEPDFTDTHIRGKRLIVLFGIRTPYVMYNEETKSLTGFLAEVWNVFEDYYNVTSEYIEYDIDIQKFDIWLWPIPPVFNVTEQMELTQTVDRDSYSLYMKPMKSNVGTETYLRTLSTTLWLAGLGAFVFLCIALTVSLKIVPAETTTDRSLGLCFLAAISGFCVQGSEMRLSTWTGRIILLSSLILGFLIYTAFAAVLIAALSTDTNIPIQRLADVRALKTHSLCMRNNNIVFRRYEVFVTQVNETTYEVLPEWKGIFNGPECTSSLNDKMNIPKLVCKDKTIILEENNKMAQMEAQKLIPCSIKRTAATYFHSPKRLAVTRKWPFKEKINWLINLMRNYGIVSYLRIKYLIPDNYNQDESKIYTNIEVSHIKPLFQVYGIAVVVSLIILTLEIIYFKYTTFSTGKFVTLSHDSLSESKKFKVLAEEARVNRF